MDVAHGMSDLDGGQEIRTPQEEPKYSHRGELRSRADVDGGQITGSGK
ncbi:MAG: hypothetical protein Q4C47_00100 [Planctomycetia bacterium]|nr:hypothetical protein [Planctomycetia bacterium]